MSFNYFFIISTVFLFFGCKKKESFDDVEISAHAVSGINNPSSMYPENSLEGLNYALQFIDLNGIEIDIQFSSEGTLWMYHDPLLGKNTNGQGRLCELNDDEVQKIHLKNLDKTPISKLSDADWSLSGGHKKIYLDFKNIGKCNEVLFTPEVLMNKLSQINFSQYDNLELFLIINDTLFASQMSSNGYKVYSDVPSFERAKEQLDIFYNGILIRNSKLSKEQVADLESTGKKVILYDMFSLKSLKEGFRKYPSGLLVEDFKTAIIEKN